MPPREVLVTYTAHPTGSADVHQAISAINSQLPLRNLHWKPSNRTSLRTIQELDVRLVELGDAAGGSQSVGGSILEKPLVNLCLVVCEDNDTYKNSTKSFVRDWLSLLAARRNEHALIVLVNPHVAGAPKGAGVFGKTGGVLGKLKTDFNVGKKDRCVQVNLPAPGVNDPTAWPETINKLKETILGAFDEVLLEREEEVKRGEAQRMMVGWNFCSWFLLKESLAISLEGMNLLEDTLIQYDELEASFFQVLKEQNLSWFGKLGASGPQDDSLPVLDWKTKPYRTLIQNSQITIFDFRIYVFARQCELLGKLGRVTEAVSKAQWFVASLGRRLRESEDELAGNFVESWTYHACLDIVSKCGQWAAEVHERPGSDVETALAGFDAAKAEVLDMARLQVERIGVEAGHLPKVFPFIPPVSLLPPADDVLFDGSDSGSSMADETQSQAPARAKISSRELLEAVADKGQFDELYSALTERVLEAYDSCGRRRQALRLRGCLASLQLHNGHYAKAFEIYHELSGLTSLAPRWDDARAYAMKEAIKAHRLARLPIDSRWTALALAYLHIESCRPEGLVSQAAEAEAQATAQRLTEVLETLHAHAESFEDDVLVEDHAAFSVRVLDSQARPASDQDGNLLQVDIVNQLPVPISADNVRVCFWNDDVDQMWFATGPQSLQPGSNVFSAYCPMVVHGSFNQDVAQVSVGRFNFDYVSSANASASLAFQRLRVTQDPGALDLRVEMPTDIALDQPPRIIVTLTSGRNHIDRAVVKLSVIEDDVRLGLSRASLAAGDAQLEVSPDVFVLGEIQPQKSVSVALPYAGQPRSDYLNLLVVVEYTTKNAPPRLALTLRKARSVVISLPLAVNVQDFFRPECLLSKFTVSSDGRANLRIANVNLETESPDSAVEIKPCRRPNAPPALVTTKQPVSFVYKLVKRRLTGDIELLRLAIRYRTVADETVESIRSMVESLSLPGSSAHGAFIQQAITNKLAAVQAADVWTEKYLATGLIDLGEWDRPKWIDEQVQQYTARHRLDGRAALDISQAFEKAIESLDSDTPLITSSLPWRTLRIPVDIPQRSVLARTSLKINSSRSLIYEGQAVAATLSLSTSSAWANGKPTRGLTLSYDVFADSDAWLITGQKRGRFTTDGQGELRVELLLVPMRHGPLPIPTVVVQPLLASQSRGFEPAELPSCEAYQDNAATVIDVLPSRGRTAVLIPIARAEDTWDRETSLGIKI